MSPVFDVPGFLENRGLFPVFDLALIRPSRMLLSAAVEVLLDPVTP
jgi:hypothetical protein